jgi:nucleoside-diphosphate-sugar epimerase
MGMATTAILGATGPTGIHLTTALRRDGVAVRVVSRGMSNLDRMFPDAAIEKRQADMLDEDETLRAVEDCDLVYDCIGLPPAQMHLHPLTARNIARALRQTKARCVQVSSYWAYFPQARAQMNESHPRTDGAAWVRYRREAEDILFAAGAAILHLPDFYGPHVHSATLQNALIEAAHGKTMNWLGRPDIAREYIFVPDAMRIACAIGQRPEAFGAHWCLPGSGPLTGRQVAETAGRLLGRPVKLRSAGLVMLRMLSLFSSDLRGLMQVAPEYVKPVRYDAGKLEGLLGPQAMTSYEAGIGQTLDWMMEILRQRPPG